jgi:ribonuclease P protein component
VKRFSLSRDERITGKKNFTYAFENGSSLFSGDRKIKAVYVRHIMQNDRTKKPGVQIAAAVSKRNGNAVWRNRIRRLVKESYRLEKLPVVEKAIDKKILLQIIFLPVGFSKQKTPVVGLNDIKPSVEDILNQILVLLEVCGSS